MRKVLGEPPVKYFGISYGTGIGWIYAQMFPDHVGATVLHGLENIRIERLVSGFGDAALYVTVRAWRDDFIRECVKACPRFCFLLSGGHEHDTGWWVGWLGVLVWVCATRCVHTTSPIVSGLFKYFHSQPTGHWRRA